MIVFERSAVHDSVKPLCGPIVLQRVFRPGCRSSATGNVLFLNERRAVAWVFNDYPFDCCNVCKLFSNVSFYSIKYYG